MDYALIRGDALRLPLADNTVDAIITSPPYFALRSYQDGGEHYDGQIGSEDTPAAFLAALWAVSDECWRVLKPTGSMFVDLGDKYAGSGGHNNSNLGVGASKASGSTLQGGRQFSHRPIARELPPASRRNAPDRYNQATDVPIKSLMGLPWRYALGLTCPDVYRTDGALGPQWTLRAELVWSKPNGLPESVTDRVRRSHETWFHFTRGPKYFAAVDEIREKQTGNDARSAPHVVADDSHDGTSHRVLRRDPDMWNPLGKLPGSVWTIPSEPLVVPAHLGVDHFAAFPQEWCRRLILGWTPNGICVKCGEGRRPVANRSIESTGGEWGERGKVDPNGQSGTERDGGFNDWRTGQPIGSRVVTITGYACACDVPIAATRPAVVLDPFVGTGTVPTVARALGRYGVGIDLSRDYLRLARWRISQSRHGAKSVNRTNRERQGALW
jgi:DNA modification methylase